MIYCITHILLVTTLMYYIYKRSSNKQKYLFKEKIFRNRLKKELRIINSYFKNNQSIKLSRKFISLTYYNKNNRNNKVYEKRCKIISTFQITHKKILIAVHSHISLFYQRFVFRKTYKKYKNIQLLFFIGLDFNQTNQLFLKEEIKIYNDIVLFNFCSNYKNLQYLTYNFILWIKEYKYLYDIIIKQDTDTFLNINLLQNIIFSKIYNKTDYVLGFIWYFNINSKQYPSGMSYIFPSQSIDKLTNNIEKKYKKFMYGYPEDKFFGYLARQANFTFYDSYHNFSFKCCLQIPDKMVEINHILMIHGLRISEIAFFNSIIHTKHYNF